MRPREDLFSQGQLSCVKIATYHGERLSIGPLIFSSMPDTCPLAPEPIGHGQREIRIAPKLGKFTRQKITFAIMCTAGIRGLLIYCLDCRWCSH